MSFYLIFALSKIFLIVILFWAIVFVNTFFFKIKNNKTSKTIYECGFKSYKNISIDLNVNFFFSVALILLYELEFLFLIPFFFNLKILNATTIISVLILFFVIFITFFFDLKFKIIKWIF